MTNRSATRTISISHALAIAEKLVSAPGNEGMVVWLQPARGGVTLRQQFVRTAKAAPSGSQAAARITTGSAPACC